MDSLKDLLDKAHYHKQSGNRRAWVSALCQLMEKRREYYLEGRDNRQLDIYTDGLFKILLLELDDKEEESIETAELAYLGISTLLQQTDTALSEYYKRRILLVHYFTDYFTTAIIDIFLDKYKREHRLQARNLAIEHLEKMQMSDISYLEENNRDFINHDEQLADVSNTIKTGSAFSDEEHQQAILMHRILHAYLKVKYKN